MPFKSQAQKRRFAQLLVEGKISNETFEEWNRETGGKKLPERGRTQGFCSKKSEDEAEGASVEAPRVIPGSRWRVTAGRGRAPRCRLTAAEAAGLADPCLEDDRR